MKKKDYSTTHDKLSDGQKSLLKELKLACVSSLLDNDTPVHITNETVYIRGLGCKRTASGRAHKKWGILLFFSGDEIIYITSGINVLYSFTHKHPMAPAIFCSGRLATVNLVFSGEVSYLENLLKSKFKPRLNFEKSNDFLSRVDHEKTKKTIVKWLNTLTGTYYDTRSETRHKRDVVMIKMSLLHTNFSYLRLALDVLEKIGAKVNYVFNTDKFMLIDGQTRSELFSNLSFSQEQPDFPLYLEFKLWEDTPDNWIDCNCVHSLQITQRDLNSIVQHSQVSSLVRVLARNYMGYTGLRDYLFRLIERCDKPRSFQTQLEKIVGHEDGIQRVLQYVSSNWFLAPEDREEFSKIS